MSPPILAGSTVRNNAKTSLWSSVAPPLKVLRLLDHLDAFSSVPVPSSPLLASGVPPLALWGLHSSQLPSTDDDRTREKRACPSAPALSLSCSRTNTD